jgi:hypothetical protein
LMHDVGTLPRRMPPAIREWTFGEWRRRGAAVGIRVEALQDPLYYVIKHEKIFKRASQRPVCSRRWYGETHKRCGRAAYFWGAVVKFEETRLNLCRDCGRYLRRRGQLLDDLHRTAPAA